MMASHHFTRATGRDPLHAPKASLLSLKMKNVLFLCSRNRLRSPTAEQVFSSWPNIEVASAGLNYDAETTLSAEIVRWADIIFVMERAHRSKLQRRFGNHIRGRVVCLDIPDKYEFMDPALVSRLHQSVSRFLS